MGSVNRGIQLLTKIIMQRLFDNKYNSEGSCLTKNEKQSKSEQGFSLVEVVFAMTILLIVMLGVFFTFTYAISFNAGNNSRSEALAVLQQEVENLRSAKFTPAITNTLLIGGERLPKLVTLPNGDRFIVNLKVDDDPFTAGIQIDDKKTIKEITLKVSLDRPTPGWQTAVPAEVILQRVRSN